MIDVHSISTHCTRTESVGTAVLDTIGFVMGDKVVRAVVLEEYIRPFAF